MRVFILCVVLSLLVQCGQARHLLVEGQQVKCSNLTGTCSGYQPETDVVDVWEWNGTKDVWSNETTVVQQGSCCAFNGTETCDIVACRTDRVKIVGANTTSVTGKLWVEAEDLCCEPAFTSNDNCTDAAVTCPAQSGAVLSEDGQLEGIAKSDAAGIVDVCCAPLPACDASTVCADGQDTKNASFVPDTEDERAAFCCLYPINATCANLDAAIENGTALNCTAEAGYDFPFVLPPAASRAAAAEPENLGGKSKLDALDLCCVKRKYSEAATCALNFNCSALATPMMANASNADSSLAAFDLVDAEGVAALCCQAIVDEEEAPATVAAWIADLATCSGVDLTKAAKVTGTATLVNDTTSEDCPATCMDEAEVEITVSGQCSYATFTPSGADCPAAVGTVTLATDKTLSAISGVVPSAAGVLFTVEKVADEPKQVLVTRGTCTAKYTLADALLAKIEAAPKNSATGKAASFLAAVLALLALLVL